MIGNASEEGLMQQVGNPSHLDPGRIAVPAGAALAILVFFGMRAVFPDFGHFVAALPALMLGSALAYWVYERITLAREAERAAREATYRADREAETQRQIAEMKAKNP